MKSKESMFSTSIEDLINGMEQADSLVDWQGALYRRCIVLLYLKRRCIQELSSVMRVRRRTIAPDVVNPYLIFIRGEIMSWHLLCL